MQSLTESVTDHAGISHDITIPPGWRRVRTGALVPGDHHLNICLLTDVRRVAWQPVSKVDLNRPHHEPYATAEWFGLVIRREGLG